MALNITSPVTGGAQTGFTTPSLTVTADAAPELHMKQWAVTAVSGMPSVTLHSVSSPFTVTLARPKNPKTLPQGSLSTSLARSIPNNRTSIVSRKGVTPASGYNARVAIMRTYADVPAGSETYDSANVRGLASLHFGVCAQISSGFGDTLVSGLA